jgi:hypothetical protein
MAARLPDNSDPPLSHVPDTPLYNSLTTNLPIPVMLFPSHKPTPSTHLFPRAQEVIKYLQSYEGRFGLRRFIHFNTVVSCAFWNGQTNQWEVSIHPRGQPERSETQYFDHLLVTNGHYAKPYIPNFEGLDEWRAQAQGTRPVMHSMWYREPSPYQGLRVLIIGGRASGNDLASDISKVAKETIQSATSFEDETINSITKRGTVDHFTADGLVVFKSGKRAHVDRVILATGYKYDFPFLPQLPVRPPGVDETSLYSSELHIYPLAQHIFPLLAPFPPNSMAFFGLPTRVVPFPLFEAQALLAVRIMSGCVKMDFEHELEICKARRDRLLSTHDNSIERVARIWYILDDVQFNHREELWRLAGENDRTVPEWTRKFYEKKDVLRDEWKDLVRRGEADAWADGVGKGGIDEWVDLMHRVLRRAENRGKV